MTVLRILPMFRKRPQMARVKNPLFRMFLQGLRGIYEINYKKPYNYYVTGLTIAVSILLSQYLIKLSKTQFQQRKKPNSVVPSYIYKVRRQNFIYWQQSRLAHGLSTTFSYYDWDAQTIKMYAFDRAGNPTVVELHSLIEKKEDMSAVFLESHYPAPPQLHHEIVLYTRNINNPYDLDNHLHHKTVNIGDWMRAFYYAVYKEIGLSNRYRHDEYVSKPRCYYDLEKVKLAFRVTRNRQELYNYIQTLRWDQNSVAKFLVWFA